MNKLLCAVALGTALFSMPSFADIGITAYAGQTYSQKLHTSKGQEHELADDTHFAVSVDHHIDGAKYGIYYSFFESELENSPTHKVDSELLLFQSAVKRPITDNLYTYVGAQLGVNRITTNFVDDDTFFATGLFAGLDYQLGAGFSVGTEVRWVATIVKNTSAVSCDNDPETVDTCSWHFDNDSLSQFQASANITYRF
ncbi:outer membrane beta-barrel protein [Pseudoalteromonas sp. S16_S37]|uniref:outer membrane beta-barrel protein n=1 Tax=Pseudoalteromonas sp. S16_S37 TaxID=2720228 RepID=UPI0016804A78|nr:outer membrane beta-barrel protein [Pseudoalteromonas sp. S16_S37]MBD1582873.1 porin family protein [Pseudoalteromonas sp. S16_S37]